MAQPERAHSGHGQWSGWLAGGGSDTAQVWLKDALIDPGNYGAFPAHAQTLQAELGNKPRARSSLAPVRYYRCVS